MDEGIKRPSGPRPAERTKRDVLSSAQGDGGASAHKTTLANHLNQFASYLFFGVVALAPLPFGSHDPTTEIFLCAILSVALICVSPHGIGRSRIWLLSGIGILILGYALVLHEQLSTSPWFVRPDPIWRQASNLLKTDLSASPSMVRTQPLFALGPTLACFMALTLGIVLGADRKRARQILLVFRWSGAAYAFYGIVSAILEPTMILWREREGYDGVVLGTFINRNTAATYFGCCAIVWALCLSETVRNRLPPGRFTWKWISRRILSEARFDTVSGFCGLVVCLMALLMTNSRAGVTLSLACVIGATVTYFRRDLPKHNSKVLAIASGIILCLLLVQFLGGTVNQRFESSGLSDEGRFDVYRAVLRMIAQHPWVGTGLGTFVWAFPAYRPFPPPMQGVWDMAHSTPLEMAAELGLPLTTLVSLAFVVAFWVLGHGVRTRRRDKILPLAGFASTALAILHSCIDFSLQIPGFSIVAMALLGTGLAQSFGAGVSRADIDPKAPAG